MDYCSLAAVKLDIWLLYLSKAKDYSSLPQSDTLQMF